MNNESKTKQDEAVITLEGEDGHSYSCQILDIFEFENQEYALLLKMSGTSGDDVVEEEEEGSLVIMRLITRDDQSIFQTIESDDEFDRVVQYVEEQAADAELEGHDHE